MFYLDINDVKLVFVNFIKFLFNYQFGKLLLGFFMLYLVIDITKRLFNINI